MEISLNELRDKAYKIASDKGFHEKNKEVSKDTFKMLVITELSEAVEADRKNRHADIVNFDKANKYTTEQWKKAFECYIKDTIEDELSDTIIRMLDYAGVCDIDLKMEGSIFKSIVSNKKTFPENCYSVVYLLINRKFTEIEMVNNVISQLFKVGEIYGIDIIKHIVLKMTYNKLREHKNGKNY